MRIRVPGALLAAFGGACLGGLLAFVNGWPAVESVAGGAGIGALLGFWLGPRAYELLTAPFP